jgi:hypothetical protein
MYAERYYEPDKCNVIQYFPGGERIIPPDQHDYLAWMAEGNQPTIEADGRFLSVVDGKLVVDPARDSILAAEAAAEKAAEDLILAKKAAIETYLPAWATVSAAGDNIGNLADAKAFIKKLARVVYWLAKNKVE